MSTLSYTILHNFVSERMRMTIVRLRRLACLTAVGLFAVIAASAPAAARADHHGHARRHHFHAILPPMASASAPVDAGFGPTAPGISTILVDARSGAVLAQGGADVPRYPASLTKLMTLDLAFQALRDGRMTLDTSIPVSYHAASVEPVKLGLPIGGSITVRQAILAMTTMSANDAATALGEYLGGGSEDRCGQMMTLRAHTLGMAQTEFYNASGLPNPNQVTTARDLSLLARDIVVNFPQFQSFFEVQNYDFNGRTIYSNNAMLKTYSGASGMKTGYTILARHNLITSAVRNGRVLIGVVLHEPSWGQTYQQMTAMLDGGFGGHIDNSMMFAQQQPADPAIGSVSAGPVAAVTVHRQPASAQQFAANGPMRARGGWTAEFGMFTRMAKARVEAMSVRQMRGVGIPRIARVQSHGKTLWSAQLAGLSQAAAHQTCNVLAARGAACSIIAPETAALAARDRSAG